ncbi:hypothetical protein SteCoe_34122 [Stentor coeruleus]|uniref:Adenylate kinase n=1 Tax=Stentor coeruleus TaxID=5963 RepID=A0A1R2AV73_9CILI|nr:hypothetical protein SteCoe_34122 [Stentor coeruleus]
MLNELRPLIEGEPSPVKVIGTLDPKDPTPRPPQIKKILHRHKPRLFRKYLLECDVIVYDLHTADLKEVEEKLSIFKTAKLEDPKLIVIVSSVMGWVGTVQKVIKENQSMPDLENLEEKQEKGLDVSGEDKKAEEEVEVQEPIEVSRPVPFEESDYQIRVPHKDYTGWKAIEDLAMSLSAKENINVYVLCAGILYGNGEKIFEYHFKSAWLEKPKRLPYLGDGENLIPTIHVKDLAKITKFVVDTKPENHYIFAIDNTKDRRQVAIVQAISSGIGTGNIKKSKGKNLEWEQYLSINVWMKTSPLLIPEEEGQLPIEWYSLDGIAGNIIKLNTEFNQKRGLRPIKVFVSGPPASGKTFFSRQIASEYNIPHIKVKDLLHEFMSNHSELGLAVRAYIDKNQRVPDELLAEVFRWKLHMNHCRNRGFILDGYPRNFTEAQNLFRKEKKTDEPPVLDEEGEPRPKEYELDLEILPQSVAAFRATNAFLMSRIEKLKHSHPEFNLERMQRRLQTYRNDNELSDKSVYDFFSDLNIEVFECECTNEEIEIIESLKIYIEREGRPDNFLGSIQEMVECRKKYLWEKNDAMIKEEAKAQEEEEMAKAQVFERREKLAHERFVKIKKELEDASSARAIPLRKYLMENIMPTLAESLIQVCRIMPEDPVDYVAELMYASSKRHRK